MPLFTGNCSTGVASPPVIRRDHASKSPELIKERMIYIINGDHAFTEADLEFLQHIDDLFPIDQFYRHGAIALRLPFSILRERACRQDDSLPTAVSSETICPARNARIRCLTEPLKHVTLPTCRIALLS